MYENTIFHLLVKININNVLRFKKLIDKYFSIFTALCLRNMRL